MNVDPAIADEEDLVRIVRNWRRCVRGSMRVTENQDPDVESYIAAIEAGDFATTDELLGRINELLADAPKRIVVPVDLLAALTDPDPCWFDHHGYCQAHSWLQDGQCPHARAKELLA